jgi:hypothetical protein
MLSNLMWALCVLYLAWHAFYVGVIVWGCAASIVGSLYNSVAAVWRGGL